MPVKFEVFKNKKGEFTFKLNVANGETITTGRVTLTRRLARRG